MAAAILGSRPNSTLTYKIKKNVSQKPVDSHDPNTRYSKTGNKWVGLYHLKTGHFDPNPFETGMFLPAILLLTVRKMTQTSSFQMVFKNQNI